MSKLKKIINKNKIFGNFFQDYIDYLYDISKNIDKKQLNSFFNELKKIRNKNKTIFIAGNGGSAANSLTVENDLGFDVLKRSRKKPFKIFPLVSNVVVLTAISNDISYDKIFSYQLENFASIGDLLIIFSCSGNSKNILNVAKLASKKKLSVISFIGFSNKSILKNLSNIYVNLGTKNYGICEDVFQSILHILSQLIRLESSNKKIKI